MAEISFLAKLESTNFISISDKQLENIKSSSKLIFEEDTLISGYVRIFEINNFFIFQENTPKGEILIRKFDKRKNAEELVHKRLEIYEKMWNGCGCRIDYY